MQRLFSLGIVWSLFLAPLPSAAVTEFQPITLPFTQDLELLKASLALPVTDRVETITIPTKKLKTRAFNPKKDPTIEPINFSVPKTESGLSELVERVAVPGKSEELLELFLGKIKKQGPSPKSTVKIELDPGDFKWINLKSLGEELAKEHHKVTVKTRELAQEKETLNEFRNQLSYHLSREQLNKINRKVKNGLDLEVDTDLLPPFARKMAGKFIVFRGPNCFHASLAFFDQQLTRLPTVNVKEEEGYHRSMINYDELWRVINGEFYEIDPRQSNLKYGDLLVFYGVPQEQVKQINFKWIRHTAVYLFGPYTFSKGSKSPNSPYTVKTLEEEWTAWKALTQNLGLKVYRRQINVSSGQLPASRVDWIY